MSKLPNVARGVNALIIDSGGASSLSSLLILDQLMTRLQGALGLEKYPNVFDHFDIVAGAGTGAIIVCLVGRLRVPVRQAIEYYQRLADVFSKKRPIGGDEGTFKINKLATVMKAIVRDATGHENTSMLDTRLDGDQCKTMVFAMSKYNMNAAMPSIFRSYQGANNQLDDSTIWEAACASMAHPELFRGFDVGQGPLRQSYVGGTLGCGNPIEHVLVEAKALFPDRYLSSIVSIGAGHTRTIQISQPRLLKIVLSTNAEIAIKDVAKDCEAAAQRMFVRFQQVPNVYFRFSVEQGMQDVKLCDWEKLGEVKAHTAVYMRRADIGARLDLAVDVVKGRTRSVHMGIIDGQVRPPPVQSAVVMLCPAPTPVFTGREDMIRQVVECLSGGDKKRCVFVLHGMGGAGKTQMALKVVERTNGIWSDLVYVDATTQETTLRALESFAQAKGIGATHQDTLAYLSNRRKRWLMLVDNADDPSLGVNDYLPRGDHGSILITSRLADMALLGRGSMSDFQMSSMKPEETLELLLKTTRIRPSELIDEERRAANDLVEELGHLALAVVHAGAYIHSSGLTIRQYHAMFRCQRQAMLDMYGKIPVKIDRYQKSVYTTWIMSYEKLSPRAKELMGLMAYMHHSNITEDIFRRAATGLQNWYSIVPLSDLELRVRSNVRSYLKPYLDQAEDWDSRIFVSAMTELVSYSLVNYDRASRAYSLHMLVHDWTRTVTMRPQTLAVQHTIALLAGSISHDNTSETMDYTRALNVHVDSALDTNPNLSANDAKKFAYVYMYSGRWDKEERMANLALSVCREELGEKHTKTLQSMRDLASAYLRQGRPNEAEKIELYVVDVRKKTLGDEHPDTLESIHNLALTYLRQGRTNEAVKLLLRVVDAYKQKLGDEHPHTLQSVNNLARTFLRQGRLSEAEELQLHVVDARKQKLGDEHPHTLESMSDIAITYLRQVRLNEAEELQLHVVDACKKKLGDEHPQTLGSMNHLASTYLCQGRLKEAEALQLHAVDVQKKNLGSDHPDTLCSMHNLAVTYSDQGRLNEAEELQLRLVDACKKKLGDGHPDTLTSISSLANTYLRQGRLKEAEVLNLKVLDVRIRMLGDKHPDTLDTKGALATNYHNQRRYEESEVLGVTVLDDMKKTLGVRHPSTLRTMRSLAHIYKHLGPQGQPKRAALLREIELAQ